MNVLALDASTDALAVSLSVDDQVYELNLDAGLRHSERMMTAADTLCATAGIRPDRLDAVACMFGPGSFTGLRIGMAGAKGIAVSLGIPLYAVPTLECIAGSYVWTDLVLPTIDAKQRRWYAALFRNGARLSEDLDATAEELSARLSAANASSVLVCGANAPRAAEILAPLLPAAVFHVAADHRRGASRALLNAALSRIRAGDPGEADERGLHYLRKSEAETTREQANAEGTKG